jgi:hypothetical protein
MGQPARNTFELEYLFTYQLKLARFEVLGSTGEGLLALAFPEGGNVTGPKLSGSLLTYGGDRLVFRVDGVALPDVRLAVQIDTGDLVYVEFAGVMDAGPDGYQDFLAQRLPAVLPAQGSVRVRAAAREYQWFNRLQCLGVAEIDFARMELTNDIYAVR